MNREEFIKLCVSMGYCTKREIKKWFDQYPDRTEFSEGDIEEVYRWVERQKYLTEVSDKHSITDGYTTKSYYFEED